MCELIDSVICILKDEPWPVAKAGSDIDEGKGDKEDGKSSETPGALPTHGLESGHIVLRDELLFIHHLGRNNDLGAEDKHVSKEDTVGVILAVGVWLKDGKRRVAELRVVHFLHGIVDVVCAVVGFAGLLIHHVRHPNCD